MASAARWSTTVASPVTASAAALRPLPGQCPGAPAERRYQEVARMNEYLVITWADSVPVEDGRADAARDRGGQLLAAGPVHDASELDSRPAPAGLVIARFSTEEAARSWFNAVLDTLDGTTLLAAGATAPVWWPPEKESERPQW